MTDWRARSAELLSAVSALHEQDVDAPYSPTQDAAYEDLIARTRAELAQPAPPADGEVAELVAALETDAECVEVEHYDLCNMTAEQMRRAATLLQQLSAIEDLKND